jgi:S1-C subfamily serine protease
VYSLLMWAALPGQFVDSPDFTKAQQQAAFDATVRTYHPASRSVGTAIAVGKKGPVVYFLTAAHLVPPKAIPGRESEDIRNVEMYLYKSTNPDRVSSEAVAKVMARMPNEDLAVLAVELPNFPPPVPVCPKNKRDFRLPMTVMTVGSIQDGPPEIKMDTVRTKKLLNKPDGTEALYWEADVPQHTGRSGGPMIGSNGFVLGIASGTWHQKGYYTYISEIYRSLADNGFGWLVDKPIAEK